MLTLIDIKILKVNPTYILNYGAEDFKGEFQLLKFYLSCNYSFRR
jgi:hypothetical protein